MSEPEVIARLKVHRYYCASCGNIGTVVHDVETTIIVCRCGGVASTQPSED